MCEHIRSDQALEPLHLHSVKNLFGTTASRPDPEWEKDAEVLENTWRSRWGRLRPFSSGRKTRSSPRCHMQERHDGGGLQEMISVSPLSVSRQTWDALNKIEQENERKKEIEEERRKKQEEVKRRLKRVVEARAKSEKEQEKKETEDIFSPSWTVCTCNPKESIFE